MVGLDAPQERRPGLCGRDCVLDDSSHVPYEEFSHSTNKSHPESLPFYNNSALRHFCPYRPPAWTCPPVPARLTRRRGAGGMNKPSTRLASEGDQDSPSFLLRSKPGPQRGWASLKVTQQAGGQAEVSPCCPQEGQEGAGRSLHSLLFAASVQGEREAATGRNGPEERLLWGSSEHP